MSAAAAERSRALPLACRTAVRMTAEIVCITRLPRPRQVKAASHFEALAQASSSNDRQGRLAKDYARSTLQLTLMIPASRLQRGARKREADLRPQRSRKGGPQLFIRRWMWAGRCQRRCRRDSAEVQRPVSVPLRSGRNRLPRLGRAVASSCRK